MVQRINNRMTIEIRNAPLTLELREKMATGIAAPFNSNSFQMESFGGAFVERIAEGAFTRSLREAANGEANIYALWAHDNSQPLGSTRSKKLTLEETDKGLAFAMDTARMSEMQRSALEDGDTQMSFGFRVREEKWRELEDGTFERTLIDVELLEISFVINPAYPATDAALRSLDSWKSTQIVAEPVPDIESDSGAQLRRLRMFHSRMRRGR